jgi:hypothetical protein
LLLIDVARRARSPFRPSLNVVANRRLATSSNGSLVYWRQNRASLSGGANLGLVRRQSDGGPELSKESSVSEGLVFLVRGNEPLELLEPVLNDDDAEVVQF